MQFSPLRSYWKYLDDDHNTLLKETQNIYYDLQHNCDSINLAAAFLHLSQTQIMRLHELNTWGIILAKSLIFKFILKNYSLKPERKLYNALVYKKLVLN